MKKIILTLIGMVAGAALVHAQGGLLSWQSANTKPYTTGAGYNTGYPSITTSNTISGSGSGLYYFVLLAATSTASGDAGNPFATDWSAVTFSGNSTVAQGTNNVAPGSVTGLGGTAGFASSLNAGTTYFDMVVAWSASLGTTWAAASSFGPSFSSSPSGFFGYSNVGTITPTAAPANGALIFGGSSAQPGQTILYTVPVPEPTTLALAGLGGISMLFLRRRKA